MKHFLIVVASCIIVIFLLQISSCSKNTVTTVTKIDTVTVVQIDTVAPKACNVIGNYAGTNTTAGVTVPIGYELDSNNFAIGLNAPNGTAVTYGSYTNTCDSVIISVFYTANNDYYILRGALLNNGSTISGTYIDLTSSVTGTFTLSK